MTTGVAKSFVSETDVSEVFSQVMRSLSDSSEYPRWQIRFHRVVTVHQREAIGNHRLSTTPFDLLFGAWFLIWWDGGVNTPDGIEASSLTLVHFSFRANTAWFSVLKATWAANSASSLVFHKATHTAVTIVDSRSVRPSSQMRRGWPLGDTLVLAFVGQIPASHHTSSLLYHINYEAVISQLSMSREVMGSSFLVISTYLVKGGKPQRPGGMRWSHPDYMGLESQVTRVCPSIFRLDLGDTHLLSISEHFQEFQDSWIFWDNDHAPHLQSL